jgi:nucleoside-diphosphate kinase
VRGDDYIPWFGELGVYILNRVHKTAAKIGETYQSKRMHRPVAGSTVSLTFATQKIKQQRQMSNRTFTMIKPDAMKSGHAGLILDRIIKEGYKVVALKMTKLSSDKAGEFYAIHKERPFYGELVEFMSSGPVIAAILEKSNAVADFRTLIGATNPAQAAEGTIRKLYAASVGENAVHGSDSDDNAKIEGDFFFSGLERVL